MKTYLGKVLVVLCLMVAFLWAAQVDVETFAKSKKASFHWYPVQKTITLAGVADTVKLALDLPYATLNGKTIHLKAAPALKDNKIWMNAADTSKFALNSKPASSSGIAKANSSSSVVTKVSSSSSAAAVVVATPKNETAGTREVKTIVIDPGHGGKDSGALGAKAQEKDIVLAVGRLLKKELEKEGFNVRMTRDKDVFIELGQRANLANQWDGDLFISLHCNAIDATPEKKKQIKGYHVYVLRAPESEEDKAIARRENKVATLYGEKNAKEELTPIEWFKLEARLEKYKQNSYMFTEEMLKAFDGGKIRRQAGGVGGAGFMVLVGALMPAVLFEIGFISNPDDEAYMMSSKGQEEIAERVSKAVASYKKAVHNYRETLGR